MKKILLILPAFYFQSVFAQLTIQEGETLYVSGDAKITLLNMNLINNGILTVPANGRFVFNGTENNEISGSQLPAFSELEIAKTGSGMLSLNTDIIVKNKIVFTSNLINLKGKNIDLLSSGFLELENESSRITGTEGGEIIFTANLVTPSAINPGNLGALISSSQNMGNTIIRRGHQSQTGVAGGGSSIQRYFDIIPATNTALNATLRINYFDAELNLLNENDLELWRSANNINWTNEGKTSANTTSNMVEKTGIDQFSRWTLSTASGTLPVTGLKLSGEWKNNAAFLNWLTVSEYNNSHFNIERKYEDDLSFAVIGRKNSAHANGTSNNTTFYDWIDAARANKGLVQYRLKQTDLDGKYAYSNIIVIRPEVSAVFIENMYPTIGVKKQLYLQTGNTDIHTMQVQVYDIKGRLLIKKQLAYQSQWITLPDLNAGIYRVQIQSGENHWSGSFIK